MSVPMEVISDLKVPPGEPYKPNILFEIKTLRNITTVFTSVIGTSRHTTVYIPTAYRYLQLPTESNNTGVSLTQVSLTQGCH